MIHVPDDNNDDDNIDNTTNGETRKIVFGTNGGNKNTMTNKENMKILVEELLKESIVKGEDENSDKDNVSTKETTD